MEDTGWRVSPIKLEELVNTLGSPHTYTNSAQHQDIKITLKWSANKWIVCLNKLQPFSKEDYRIWDLYIVLSTMFQYLVN